MQVFRRVGSIIHINFWTFLLNFIVLYAFYFVSEPIISIIGTTKRGFFCVDPSIHYEQKREQVPTLHLRIYSILLIFCTVILVEAFRNFYCPSEGEKPTFKIGKWNVPQYLVTVVTFLGYNQVGFIMNEVLVKYVKSFVGRLRPYFHQICNPLPIDNCSIHPQNANTFVLEYTCQGHAEEVDEARKSFYSGHSATAMFSAFWVVLYLQARLKPAIRNNVLVALLQTLVMIGGLFICCTRITDNKHHWSDVAVGIAVGMAVAAGAAVWWGKLFETAEVGDDVEEEKPLEEEMKADV
ncbi:unnamed protein product [Caenorhabditis sp. 36 PRJEB53466]|nr:unnamed protein product [Caenorhabditis sp. 36 PRJEB53466]